VRLKKKITERMYGKNYAPKGTTTKEATTEITIEKACSFEDSKGRIACFMNVKPLILITKN